MKHVGSTARRRICVLVTAFGTFPGARTNPTTGILGYLKRSRGRFARLGIDLRCAELPVVYAEIDHRLATIVAEVEPDAILHLGLAGRRKMLCVETRAINRAGPLHPDASGRRPASQILAGGAPQSLATRYPAGRILAAIRAGGLPARRSIDAGDYVCNAVLYRSLLSREPPFVGFLHVPRPRRASQPTMRTRIAKPTIEALAEATLAAVIVMARRRCVGPPATAAAPRAPRTGAAPADR